MENVDGFSVERAGEEVHLSFYDVFGIGEVYTFTPDDARRIAEGISEAIGPPLI